MKLNDLYQAIQKKRSYLCIGLDTDIDKIPSHLLNEDDPVFTFNEQIIKSTSDLCVAYKLNTAFYEARGSKGWDSLAKTISIIPSDIFIIADAKRGDIGNTSKQYAKAFFEELNVDAITLSPYMGEDSIRPYLDYSDKVSIILALTSNEGSADFQLMEGEAEKLYERVIRVAKGWSGPENMMFVVGATHPEELGHIRKLVPDHFLLIPGVGSQRGDLEAVSMHGMNQQCGILVNSSRGIIYAGDGADYTEQARNAAKALQEQMAGFLEKKPAESN